MRFPNKASLGFGAIRLYSEWEKDQYIGALVAQWEKEKRAERPSRRPFITISRQYGCMALETGLRFTERLNQVAPSGPAWILYDKEIVHKIATDLKMSKHLVELITEKSRSRIAKYMDAHFKKWPVEDHILQESIRVIRGICEKGHSVVIGRGACKIAGDLPDGFHIRIVAPTAWRVEQVASFYQISGEEALNRIRLIDADRKVFFEKHFHEDISNPDLYHMVLNQERLSMGLIVDLVVQAMEGKGLISSRATRTLKQAG